MADVYKFRVKLAERNYRRFDAETINALLKGDVQRLQEAYEEFEDWD